MTASDHISSVETTFRIIEALDELGEAGVTEVSAAVDASNGTVHKHLNTLRSLGYVRKNGTAYALSLRFFGIGARTCSRYELVRVAKPSVDELGATAGAAASLVVLERGYGVHAYRAPWIEASDESLPPLGERVYLHATAPGKAILSELEWDEVREIIDDVGLPDVTETTSSNPEYGREFGSDRDASPSRLGRAIYQLRRELRTVRDRGFALERGDSPSSVPRVAAPITAGDRPVAAVCVFGDGADVTAPVLEEEFAELAVRTANEIEADLSRR